MFVCVLRNQARYLGEIPHHLLKQFRVFLYIMHIMFSAICPETPPRPLEPLPFKIEGLQWRQLKSRFRSSSCSHSLPKQSQLLVQHINRFFKPGIIILQPQYFICQRSILGLQCQYR